MFTLYGLKNGKKIAHAVNVINIYSNNKVMHIYYDLTIRELDKNEDGIIVYNPTVKILTEEEYEALCNNEVVKIKFKKDIEGLKYETILFVKSDYLNPTNKKIKH